MLAQAALQPQKFHVKPLPGEIFIGHGINQETRLETLRGYLTPASHFFVRQHAATPALDTRTWRLRIEGNAVERPVELGFDDLLRLPSRSVICFVECAGNGRGFFKEFMGKVASGTQWRFGGTRTFTMRQGNEAFEGCRGVSGIDYASLTRTAASAADPREACP